MEIANGIEISFYLTNHVVHVNKKCVSHVVPMTCPDRHVDISLMTMVVLSAVSHTATIVKSSRGFRRCCNFIELLSKRIKVFGTSVMEYSMVQYS